MSDTPVAAKPESVKSRDQIDGNVKKFTWQDTTLTFPDGKRPLTTFTKIAVLLIKTSGSATLYFSAITKDDGWRGDVDVKAYLQVDGVSIATFDLGVVHAFCGTTNQALQAGITPEQFDLTNTMSLDLSGPNWKRC